MNMGTIDSLAKMQCGKGMHGFPFPDDWIDPMATHPHPTPEDADRSCSTPPRHPLADRRFQRARDAVRDEAWTEAADLFLQTIELAPDWVPAWIGLGEARSAAGDKTGAEAAFHQALVLAPDDRHGASLRLAALNPAERPAAAPPAYVGALFDAYAPRFEAHLLQGLGYRAPAVLVEALDGFGLRQFTLAIDLGCGTGLGGVALRPLTGTLIGIDLSEAMVAIAKAKTLYDRLIVGDIVDAMATEPAGSADLVFAADVFVYLGDLSPILRQSARALVRPGGAIAFTAQRCAHGVEVGADMRFAHGFDVVEDALRLAGFDPLLVGERTTRRENGRDVPGLVAIATRLPHAQGTNT